MVSNCARDGPTLPVRCHPQHPDAVLRDSLMGWPFMVLMPIFAAQILHGGPHTLGFLMGAVGVGRWPRH